MFQLSGFYCSPTETFQKEAFDEPFQMLEFHLTPTAPKKATRLSRVS